MEGLTPDIHSLEMKEDRRSLGAFNSLYSERAPVAVEINFEPLIFFYFC
jgi:hypothetical protein